MSLSKYSSDPTFWEPVKVPEISKVIQCFSNDGKIVDRRIVKHLPASIRDILIKAIQIGTSGNGFCFLNACLALLCRICSDYADFPYEMFRTPYKDYLLQAGEENVENPNTLDTDKAATAFRYLILIQFGITNISFLVLYSDGAYKFSPELGANGKAIPYTNHLFVLILQSGHFTAVSIDKPVQNTLYCALLEEDKKDHTKHVCATPSNPTKADLRAIYYASTGEKLIDFDGTLDDLRAIIEVKNGSALSHVKGGARQSTSEAVNPHEPSLRDMLAMIDATGV